MDWVSVPLAPYFSPIVMHRTHAPWAGTGDTPPCGAASVVDTFLAGSDADGDQGQTTTRRGWGPCRSWASNDSSRPCLGRERVPAASPVKASPEHMCPAWAMLLAGPLAPSRPIWARVGWAWSGRARWLLATLVTLQRIPRQQARRNPPAEPRRRDVDDTRGCSDQGNQAGSDSMANGGPIVRQLYS